MKVYILSFNSGYTSENWQDVYKNKEDAVKAFERHIDNVLNDDEWAEITREFWGAVTAVEDYSEFANMFDDNGNCTRPDIEKKIKEELKVDAMECLDFTYDGEVVYELMVREQEVQ